LNLSSPGKTTDYVVTGVWSKKAAEEVPFDTQIYLMLQASKYSSVNVAFSSETTKFAQVSKGNWNLSKDPAYVYYCDNETINGVC
jgi:phosphoserine aminotransferase